VTLLPLSARPAPKAKKDAGGLRIRLAAGADLEALAAIESAAFASDRLTRRRLRALMAAPSARLLVAERGGAPVGYALVLLRRGSRVARLYSIAVAAPEAGRGTGRRLVAAAEAAACQAGAGTLRLEVRADNGRALGLYQAMGYAAIGERPGYYADGMAALRYEKPLTRAGA
jgi:[ribosomal protein S18]-alanine N-acetyltransferase